MQDRERHSGRRQMVVGIAILVVITVFACALLTGWRYLPSPLGDWLGVLAGVISTPFLMEGFFIVLGFTVVLWLNQHRRNTEGDEWVDLASFEDTNANVEPGKSSAGPKSEP